MTVKKFKELLKHEANAELTLFNEQGERYYAGPATEVTSNRSSLSLSWPVYESMYNVFPFTYAMLHDNNKILAVTNIRPLDPDVVGNKIQMTYDY